MNRRLSLDSDDRADPSPEADLLDQIVSDPEGAAKRLIRYADGRWLSEDRATIGSAELTPQGYLRAPAFLTRTGVFEYQEPDPLHPDRLHLRRELRLPEEVFKKEALESLADAPLTNDHPWFGRVDARTWREVAIGKVDGARKADDGEHVAATVLITDTAAVQAALAGERRQISVGYYHTREPVPDRRWVDKDGVFGKKGAVLEPIDFIQRDIEANHVALVEAGRAGPTAQLRLDSAGNQIAGDPAEDDMDLKEALKRVAELELELATAKKLNTDSAAAATATKDSITKLEASVASLTAEIDRLKKENGDQKLKLDAAEKSKAEAAKATFIEKHAADLGLDGEGAPARKVQLLAMDSIELKKAVLATLEPTIKLDGRDASFVDNLYEITMDRRSKDTAADTAKAVVRPVKPTQDSGAPAPGSARAKMEEDAKNAWKGKTAS